MLDVVRWWCVFFFFQAEDGIRVLVRSRGLGDVYKRQASERSTKNVITVGDSTSAVVWISETSIAGAGVFCAAAPLAETKTTSAVEHM